MPSNAEAGQTTIYEKTMEIKFPLGVTEIRVSEPCNIG